MTIRTKQPLTIEHICEYCSSPFPVPQGSQRKLCDSCLVKRVTAGKRRGSKRRKDVHTDSRAT
jgi:hypothetical protein